MVPEEGVEPTHSCLYGILSPARLPVPPLRPELRIIACPERGTSRATLPSRRALRRNEAELRKIVPVSSWVAREQRVASHGRVRPNVKIGQG